MNYSLNWYNLGFMQDKYSIKEKDNIIINEREIMRWYL